MSFIEILVTSILFNKCTLIHRNSRRKVINQFSFLTQAAALTEAHYRFCYYTQYYVTGATV